MERYGTRKVRETQHARGTSVRSAALNKGTYSRGVTAESRKIGPMHNRGDRVSILSRLQKKRLEKQRNKNDIHL